MCRIICTVLVRWRAVLQSRTETTKATAVERLADSESRTFLTLALQQLLILHVAGFPKRVASLALTIAQLAVLP